MSNVQVIRDVYEAFGRGDIPAVLGAMDENVEWREAEGNPFEPSGAPWIGPETILNSLFVKLGSDFEAFTVHPKEFHESGDTVIVEGRYTGTYKPTGKSLDGQFCHLFKVRDGKLAAFQQYTDTAQLQDVMGAR